MYDDLFAQLELRACKLVDTKTTELRFLEISAALNSEGCLRSRISIAKGAINGASRLDARSAIQKCALQRDFEIVQKALKGVKSTNNYKKALIK